MSIKYSLQINPSNSNLSTNLKVHSVILIEDTKNKTLRLFQSVIDIMFYSCIKLIKKNVSSPAIEVDIATSAEGRKV